MQQNIRSLITLTLMASFQHLHVFAQGPGSVTYTTPANFVRTIDAVSPQTDTTGLGSRSMREVKMSTMYADGLGRPLQTVIKKGSLVTASNDSADLVSHVIYDIYGREQYKLLPFVANNTGGNASLKDGGFKANPVAQETSFYQQQVPGESNFYSKIHFENSPLNRPLESFAPGASWAGSSGETLESNRRSVKSKYWLNTIADSVRIWNVTDGSLGNFGTYASSSIYPAGRLNKIVTVDEQGQQVIEFKDKDEKTILKKIQLTAFVDTGLGSGYQGWLCTYYIYDNHNNLRCVIQPEGVKTAVTSSWSLSSTVLQEQCFRYEYDGFKRMIIKKVPGAGEVFMVYDKRDRLVMTQDGNMRVGTAKWMVTKYDALNRPFETLLWNNNTAFTTHLSDAQANITYPSLSGSPTLMTVTHYDDYTGLPSGLTAYQNTWNAHFNATSNTTWPYPHMPAAVTDTRGKITWTQTRILGSSNFLNKVVYYDEQGRVVQEQSTNLSGGKDIITKQFNWAGQPLVTVHWQYYSGNRAQEITRITNTKYDDIGRIIEIGKSMGSYFEEIDMWLEKPDQIIVKMEYDALGQLKRRRLAPEYSNNNGLETLDYDYNVRGWMLGMNRAYVRDVNENNYFGFDLGYDKISNTLINNQGYASSQYNGNIAGMGWKSKGDKEKRKYDFSYDAASRLLKADFNQYTGGNFDKTAGIDFSIGGDLTDSNNPGVMLYDANGNIKRMWQTGLLLTSSSVIDKLSYTYDNSNGSNRLLKVEDAVTTNNKLGDFYNGATGSGNDYNYDANGNLILDNNKSISNIAYNHLNLPSQVSVTGKGDIIYTYDAAGNKLRKEVLETGVNVPLNGNNYSTDVITTTDYIQDAVYESKTYSEWDVQEALGFAGQLQFLSHEEGRIRANYRIEDGQYIPEYFYYDYFIKDHLGNVRMVLTEEGRQDKYPIASLEDAKLEIEKSYYDIDDTRVVESSEAYGIQDYENNCNGLGNVPSDPSFEGSLSEKVFKLNSDDGAKIGLGIALKVMAGDIIDVYGNSYYNDTNPAPGSPDYLPVQGLLEAFLGGPTNLGSAHGINWAQVNSTGIDNGFLSLLDDYSNNEPDKPRAFINVIFFDEQFKVEDNNNSFFASIVGDPSEVKFHDDLRNLVAPKNGYVYIYCSNETPVDVFFDNLQVVHTRGRILEETHYYPFGLTMAGISSKASGIKPNKEKTFQDQRIDNELGLDWVQFKWRNHDPQIGRFIEIDPLANDYFYNSTYAFSENHVTAHVELEGLEKYGINPIGSPAGMAIEKVIEWTMDFTGGARNFQDGAASKAEASSGGNNHLPNNIQEVKSVSAALQMNAGMAQMLKPGLEAASIAGSTAATMTVPEVSGLVNANNFGLKAGVSLGNSVKLGGISNPIPKEVSRVVPASISKLESIGGPGALDAFVTSSSDIKGMSASQIAKRLTIPESKSGYKVITFPTPQGIASPIRRPDPGFVGGGKTRGGATEFVVPNTPVPKDAKIKIVL